MGVAFFGSAGCPGDAPTVTGAAEPGRVTSPSRGFAVMSTPSSVARRAAQLALDVILLNQCGRNLSLIGRRRPAHIEDLVAGPDVLLGVSVAVDAEAHLERRALGHHRLLIDLTVARRAANSLVDVDTVVEIDVVGK